MSDSVELVRSAYEGYARRTIAEHRHLFAPGFQFHMRTEFPLTGPYGIDDLPAMWADLDETFTDYELVPTDFDQIGDRVLVTLSVSALMRGAEARIRDTIFHVWLVREGKF